MFKPNKNRPIYVYLGGSFNPVHLGHLAMANAIHHRLHSLDISHHVYLMPSHNPFKAGMAMIEDEERLKLIQLMLDEKKLGCAIGIEPYELQCGKHPNYTLDTLSALKEQHPDVTLIFAMGQDSFEALPSWHGGFELLNLCHLWVFGRADTNTTQPKADFATLQMLCASPSGLVYWDDTPIAKVSSSAIRQKTLRLFETQAPLSMFYQTLNQDLAGLVIEYIYTHRLYA